MRITKPALLNVVALGGLGMLGFGLWSVSTALFWIVSGAFVFVACLLIYFFSRGSNAS